MKLHNRWVISALLFIAMGFSSIANAASIDNALLEFVPGQMECTTGGVYPNCDLDLFQTTGGSYMALDFLADGTFDVIDRIGLTPGDGVQLGSTQASGIDSWYIWGSLAGHFTTSPITVINDDVLGDGGSTRTLDFSGWNFFWNGLPSALDDGPVATITCGIDCGDGDSFVLDYVGHVPASDPSLWKNIDYALHLEGTISSVPVPGAAWLFGSGLIGLIGVARRKQT